MKTRLISRVFYRLGTGLYHSFIFLASLFNDKAKKWVAGRRNWKDKLYNKLDGAKKHIWFHVSSLGEFEQGRPLLERLQKQYPEHHFIITFFSPSGFEPVSKKNISATVVYLPGDSPSNAKAFLDMVKPEMAIFVKYDYWYYYFRELHYRKILLFIISAIFRKNQPFFKWYGSIFKDMLCMAEQIFVQDENSLQLLKSIGINHVIVSGDTRFDRVYEISAAANRFPEVETFIGKNQVFIAGSTWPKDEEILANFINNNTSELKYIIAPHEVTARHIEQIKSLLKVKAITYSDIKAGIANSNEAVVLIIDNVGMLASLYRYGDIAYIGGGFGSGIHNILEAAVFGMPLIIGPNYKKFREADELVKEGGVIVIQGKNDFNKRVEGLLNNNQSVKEAGETCSAYVQRNRGAVEIIMHEIKLPG